MKRFLLVLCLFALPLTAVADDPPRVTITDIHHHFSHVEELGDFWIFHITFEYCTLGLDDPWAIGTSPVSGGANGGGLLQPNALCRSLEIQCVRPAASWEEFSEIQFTVSLYENQVNSTFITSDGPVSYYGGG